MHRLTCNYTNKEFIKFGVCFKSPNGNIYKIRIAKGVNLKLSLMRTEIITLELPEGTYQSHADLYGETCLVKLVSIYDNWRKLSNQLRSLNARAINLPEGLSEIAFCYFMNCARLNNHTLKSGICTSFDAYSLETNKRIQIKSCSVIPDLTSFGPNSQWDELYFQDFYKEGNWDYTFDIYHIPNDLIFNQKVNSNQTFREMQLQGKRPRFSIYKDIILKYNLKPVKSPNLKEEYSHSIIRK